MPVRCAFVGLARAGALFVVVAMAGCGWEPLYADRAAGPADADLRAIKVAPIPERIGQLLAIGLRDSLNPGGETTPQRYLLTNTLVTARADLGVQTSGFGTRGRFDVYDNYVLHDSKTGGALLSGTSHIAESFDILANEYSNLVAEEDARNRAVEELRQDIVTRLTVFLERRVAEHPRPPGS